MIDVMVFTPVYRLEPETVDALFALEWDGPISWLLQRDNPRPGDDRTTGVANHLHQYRRGREVFLDSRCDAMFVVESDVIPPPDALKRLAALEADVAYGVYMFRQHDYSPHTRPVVNLSEHYGGGARNTGESWTSRGLWPPDERGPARVSGAGLGCTLIRRPVLEQIQFRTLETLPARVHCDTWFTTDVYRAGFSMMADTRVVCGHKTPEGEVLWPPS